MSDADHTTADHRHLLQFADEERRPLPSGDPLYTWELRVGRLRWAAPAGAVDQGRWILELGRMEHEFEGLSRHDEAEALERSRELVADYLHGVEQHYVD